MKRYKHIIWLSLGLVSLTLAITLTAYMLGLLPDGHKAELDARAKVAESLAVQLAGAANNNDNRILLETINTVVERNADVHSIALRNPSNKIILSSGDHLVHWVPSSNGKSTPTHVSVPLLGADGLQGTIEISFGEPSSGARILGIPVSLLMLLAFVAAAGLIGYFFMLRRALRQLDPGRVIPERVQKAFDTLSEGVIILDEKERILLANDAFKETYGDGKGPEIGSKINNLPWRMVDGTAQAGGYPWHTALREGREMREDFLSLRTPSGELHNFNVNATVISGEKDKTIGAIVTLRDMTALNQNAVDLEKTTHRLQQTQEQVDRQNNELAFMASHDSLTRCLNRRAFFQRLDPDLDWALDAGSDIAVLKIDLDHFKQLNNQIGPAIADKILVSIAEILKNICGNEHYVARYGGDEFCMVANGLDNEGLSSLNNSIHDLISEMSIAQFGDPDRLGVSIGIAPTPSSEKPCTSHDLVHHADSALQDAKKAGRGRTNWWGENTTGSQHYVRPESSGQSHQPTVVTAAPIAVGSQTADRSISSDAAKTNFSEKLVSSVARAARSEVPLGVLQIGIDSWDYHLEALGELFCKKLALMAKRKIEASLREFDTVSMLGNSGEFLIELPELDHAEDATWVVQRLLGAMREPMEIGDEQIFLSCKVGISLFPNDAREAEDLIRNAGTAMRRAIDENLRDGFKYYSAEMIQTSRKRLIVESGIRSALKHNQFELHFQPIIDANSGALCAAEALLRCTNEDIKEYRIDQIIDIAEQSFLIAEIDEWVINNGLKQMQEWCDIGLEMPKLSINISAKQLTNLRFMDRVFEAIKNVRFSPSRIQIEVTETAKMADVEVAAPQLKRLQQLGVQIALDDFGTGQASLTYLQRLHPDVIKIDRSFVTGVNTNHANATLVSAMTVMAHCLGLKVVVEGVEDQEQLEFLRETRCDQIQGYLISKPMPVAVMADWMVRYVNQYGAAAYEMSSAETHYVAQHYDEPAPLEELDQSQAA